MKTGDPKKAVVLSIVAVLVLGMAVFQILPKSEKTPARKAPAAAPATETGDVGALIVSAQERLQKDPFIHPKLQKGDAKEESVSAGKAPEDPNALSGSGPEPLPGTLETDPYRPPHPGGNAGSSQQSKGAKLKDLRKPIMLEAIVSVQRSTAFIRVGAADALGLSEGQRLPGVGVVTSIGDASVRIRTAKGVKTLRLGEESKI